MPSQSVSLRLDWRAVEDRQRTERVKRRNGLQAALIVYGVAVLLVATGGQEQPWLVPAQLTLFVAAYLWAPLWAGLGSPVGQRRTLAISAAALLAAAAVAILSWPVDRPGMLASTARLSPFISLLIPVTTGGLFWWATRRHPGLSHALGFTASAWGYQAAVGLCLGLALGLHYWLVVGALHDGLLPQLPGAATLVWLLTVNAGLTSLGAEVSLRGALFHLLAADSLWSRIAISARILALGAPLYLVPALVGTPANNLPLSLIYGLVFSIIALVLRISQRSIVGPLAASIAFQLLVSLVAV